MHPMWKLVTCCIVAWLLTVSPGVGMTPAELQKSFETRYDEGFEERDDKLAKLRDHYLAALDREMKRIQASGNLEAVIPFRDEIEKVEGDWSSLDQVGVNGPFRLKEMRRKFQGARQKIFLDHAKELDDLAEKMDLALEAKIKELTERGDIDQALLAREMRESLADDEGIKSAKKLLRLAGQGGLSRPALRLRRFGDDVEVLVFYDARSRVSMMSEVENVREETGEGGERGDTKATTLGEFVGAKGFEVDPYVSYHEVFDGKELDGLFLADIRAGQRRKESDRTGVKLSLSKKPVNPHGSIRKVIPPLPSKGGFRISCHYYVPSGNKEVRGFRFIHGVGNPIGMKNFEERGKWREAVVEAGSTHDSDRLLFYFNMEKGKNYANAQDDYIVLQDLKVEQTRFSAYLCYRVGEQGEKLEERKDPAEQSLFVLDGELVD